MQLYIPPSYRKPPPPSKVQWRQLVYQGLVTYDMFFHYGILYAANCWHLCCIFLLSAMTFWNKEWVGPVSLPHRNNLWWQELTKV